MITILIICIIAFLIYLNLRIKDLNEEVVDLTLNLTEMEIKVYNKMMEIRRNLKDEKPRGKFTKKRSGVPKATIPQSKILRKFRGNKDFHQTGSKG